MKCLFAQESGDDYNETLLLNLENSILMEKNFVLNQEKSTKEINSFAYSVIIGLKEEDNDRAFEFLKQYLMLNVENLTNATQKSFYQQIEGFWNDLMSLNDPLIYVLEKGPGSAEHFKLIEFLNQVASEDPSKISFNKRDIFFNNFQSLALFHPKFLNQNILIYLTDFQVCDKDLAFQKTLTDLIVDFKVQSFSQ